MLAGSVAAGAMFTIWNRAAHHQDPWKKYGLLAAPGASDHFARSSSADP
jgi:hypothetical protein